MNERIKLLAEQAYERQPLIVVNPQTCQPEHKIGNGGVPMYTQEFNKEKFAELIVKECMKLCTEVKDDVSNIIDKDKRELAEMAATFCYDAIKGEFGVEE